MVKKINILIHMKWSPSLLIWICCFFNFCSKPQSSPQDILEVNLFTHSNFKALYNLGECKSNDISATEIYFLDIENKKQDTIFVDTYLNEKNIFLIAPNSIITKYKENYILDKVEPFYPSAIVDTIFPYQRKIYPFFMKLGQHIEYEYIIIEPSIRTKNIDNAKINLPANMAALKQPFVVYKLINENFVKSTDEFIEKFEIK